MCNSFIRSFSVIALGCLALLCAACSSSPSDTVTEFYKAVAKGDSKTAVTFFSQEDVKPEQKTQVDGKLMMIVGELKSKMDAKGGLDSVEINKTTENADKTVTVDYTVKYKNGTSKKEDMTLAKEGSAWKIHLK